MYKDQKILNLNFFGLGFVKFAHSWLILTKTFFAQMIITNEQKAAKNSLALQLI